MTSMNKNQGEQMDALAFALTSSRKSITNHMKGLMGEPYLAKPGSYFMWKGTHPVALVAHIDTVPERRNNFRTLEIKRNKGLIWGDKGIGADDRAGIAAIIRIITEAKAAEKPIPSVIICDKEELGGVGAKELANDFRSAPPWIHMMIEIDRRGSDDVVYYQMEMDKLDAAVLRFYMEEIGGFEKAIGSFSDISVLAPEWEIAACNVSAGYYNEHTEKEVLIEAHWDTNVKRVQLILDNTELIRPLEYTSWRTRNYNTSTYTGGSSGYNGAQGVNVNNNYQDSAQKKEQKEKETATSQADTQEIKLPIVQLNLPSSTQSTNTTPKDASIVSEEEPNGVEATFKDDQKWRRQIAIHNSACLDWEICPDCGNKLRSDYCPNCDEFPYL